MSRKNKKLINADGVDIRELGYYSTPKFVGDFSAKWMMSINKGETALDPCTGKEELLGYFFDKNIEVDSFDIFSHKEGYKSNFSEKDFIEFYKENKGTQLNYDYYTLNPPYNCHESEYIKDNKLELELLFSDVGTNNMYVLFASAIIDMAKNGSVINLVIPDSFFTLKNFQGFRDMLINECSIHKLVMCPKSLFKSQGANVTSCVLIIQKGIEYQKKVGVMNRHLDIESFKRDLKDPEFTYYDLGDVFFDFGGETRVLIDIDTDLHALFKKNSIKDLYKCVSGIATGNDKVYLSKEKTVNHTHPFYKNPGKHKFHCQPNAYLYTDFLEESKFVKTFSVSNKEFLFKKGITCSLTGVKFSACLLPKGSTFSLNPNIFLPEEDIYWMISYLNSDLVVYLLRNVIIRSNVTTSGYVSKIPIMEFSEEEKKELSNLSRDIIESSGNLSDNMCKINEVIYKNTKLSSGIIDSIKYFVKNINRII